MLPEQAIRRFSTQTIPKGIRLDCWISSLCDSTWPVSDWSISPDFAVELQEAPLGCLRSVFETAKGLRRSRRTRSDVENSTEASYCLFTTDAPVNWAHNGHDEKLDAGDVVLLGQGEHDSFMEPSGFRTNILILPTRWLESWLPDPSALVGRMISKESRWGRVLSPMIRALTPELAVAPPLPPGVFVDQLGTTLALVAGESETQAMPDVVRRAKGCIRERCREPQLTAADVAASLDVPPLTLHRALRAKELTFASQLLEARFDVALQMLSSSSCAGLTTTEIGRQCGFMSASYFGRVVRRRTGHSPLELRRLSH